MRKPLPRKKPATVEELSELVEAERKAIIAKNWAKNMSVRRFQVIDTANQLVAYITVLWLPKAYWLSTKGSEDVARKIGMHIVAAKPSMRI